MCEVLQLSFNTGTIMRKTGKGVYLTYEGEAGERFFSEKQLKTYEKANFLKLLW